MSRCLRCGAGAEWIEGHVKDEPSKIAGLEVLLRRAEPWLGVSCDIDTDADEYLTVDRLRDEIHSALEEYR